MGSNSVRVQEFETVNSAYFGTQLQAHFFQKYLSLG